MLFLGKFVGLIHLGLFKMSFSSICFKIFQLVVVATWTNCFLHIPNIPVVK